VHSTHVEGLAVRSQLCHSSDQLTSQLIHVRREFGRWKWDNNTSPLSPGGFVYLLVHCNRKSNCINQGGIQTRLCRKPKQLDGLGRVFVIKIAMQTRTRIRSGCSSGCTTDYVSRSDAHTAVQCAVPECDTYCNYVSDMKGMCARVQSKGEQQWSRVSYPTIPCGPYLLGLLSNHRLTHSHRLRLQVTLTQDAPADFTVLSCGLGDANAY
jgi:hypothetical protein